MNKLTINTERSGAKLTVKPVGRIDTSNCVEFEDEVKGLTEGVTDLEIDLSDVAYISSSGLRALLTLHKTMDAKDGGLLITNPNAMVGEVLDVTGFSTVLKIQD